MNDRSPDMLKPTLIAGALFGTIAALPVLGILNCACCALVLSCGFFAAYLYSADCRRQGAEFRAGNGAIVGLISGAFYAMVHTLVAAIVTLTIGDFMMKSFLEWLRKLPNLPAENISMIDQALESAGQLGPLRLIMDFLMWLLIAAVFSTIGGLIGGAVFKVAPPPPAPPSIDPPPMFGGDGSAQPPTTSIGL